MASAAPPFDQTQSKFWGGPAQTQTSLILVSIVGGFFGLDHFWLRSPTTGFLKFFFNIFSLGLWWIQDLLQILGEKDSVLRNGLSAPIYGPMGVGAGMFFDNQPNAKPSRDPLRFLLQTFLLFVPFGVDMLIAGDSNGAMMKFISWMVPVLWPVAILWMFFTAGRFYFQPKVLLTEGTDRMFPWTWFGAEHKGRSVLGPIDVPPLSPEDAKCADNGGAGVGLSGAVASVIGKVIGAAAAPVLDAAAPGVRPAAAAFGAAGLAAAKTAEASLNIVKNTINAAHNPAVAAAATGSTLVTAGVNAIEKGPAIITNVQSQLASAASPEAIATAAGTAATALQSGGGSGVASEGWASNLAIFVLLSSVLAMGAIFAAKRLNLPERLFQERNDGRKRNDTPPKP